MNVSQNVTVCDKICLLSIKSGMKILEKKFRHKNSSLKSRELHVEGTLADAAATQIRSIFSLNGDFPAGSSTLIT